MAAMSHEAAAVAMTRQNHTRPTRGLGMPCEQGCIHMHPYGYTACLQIGMGHMTRHKHRHTYTHTCTCTSALALCLAQPPAAQGRLPLQRHTHNGCTAQIDAAAERVA